jgi:AraC family transcriptional regulator, transcriptional activator of pobA
MQVSYAVTPLAQLRARAEWRYGTLHSKPHAQLFWFTRGQGRFTIGAITRGYGPHTAVFIPARVMMSLDLSAQAQGVLVRLPVDPTLGLPAQSVHLRVGTVEAQSTLSGYFDMIERELAGFGSARDQALRAWGLLISVWIARQLDKQDGSILRDRTHILAEKYAELLEQTFRNGKGVAEYAEALGVTPTHLSRICRDSAGRPALAILQERLMHEACTLLVDTDLPARTIAEELGFSSAAYFTRSFSNLTGRTPSEFRRLYPAQQVFKAG